MKTKKKDRRKRKQHFTYEERVKIEAYLGEGRGVRRIARKIGRPRSSVSDEIRRNSVRGVYLAKKAEHKTYVRYWKARHQHLKVVMHEELRRYVEEKLKRFWSPEGIAGRLTYIEAQLPSVGKDAVYAFVKSVYGRPYERYLWNRERESRVRMSRSKIEGRTFIDRRPKSVNQRRFFGDWEGDFIVSGKRGKGALLVLVERKSRYVIIAKLLDRKVATINFILDRLIGTQLYVRSVTIDNDVCFRHHEQMSRILGAPVFFCHPYHSWEKGQVEKMNQMIRRFIPKGTNIARVSERKIAWVQAILNGRPYECLGFHTPTEIAVRSPKLMAFVRQSERIFQRSRKLFTIS